MLTTLTEQTDVLEFNPITELFDKYVSGRFSGEVEEKSFLEALVAVQMEMLVKYAKDEEKVKWLRKALADKNLKPSLEIEFAKQFTARKRMMH
jgi:hypothetical protein